MSVHLFFVLKPYSKRQIHPPSPPQQTPPTRWKIRTNPGAPTESRRISLGVGSWKSHGNTRGKTAESHHFPNQIPWNKPWNSIKTPIVFLCFSSQLTVLDLILILFTFLRLMVDLFSSHLRCPAKRFQRQLRCGLEWGLSWTMEINPICSMYGIFTYIWVIFRANVEKYSIHGAYGNWITLWLFNIAMENHHAINR